MTSVVFVHGTGVREAHFNDLFARVRAKLLERRADLKVVPCFWASKFGVTLHGGGASIPGYGTRALGDEASDAEYEVALWALLYGDPLYELRLLASQSQPDGTAAAQAAAWSLNPAPPTPDLQEALARAGIAAEWAGARATVAASPELAAATGRADANTLDELPLALARAVVAEAMRRNEAAGGAAPVLLDAALRDEVVLRAASDFGLGGRGLGGWLKEQTSTLVLNAATSYLGWKRDDLSDAALPATGDILYYLTHGSAIRAFVRETIQQAEPPVVVIAHSLGGIISVDLLAKRAVPEVALLVTVGSQSPYLYEIDALPGLRAGEPLPPHFPRWLNLYEPHDFLSYIGAGLFPGRVEDVSIDTRQPFPRAHSAYWATAATWDAILPRLP